MPTVIKIENLSKQYRLGLIGTNTLKGDMQRWWYTMRGLPDPTLMIGQENSLKKGNKKNEGLDEYIWALKDINLEVKQGEVLGIIGKNGAGKSTLLKILSRVTAPTTGHFKVKGRIASLLEVGTGFHPELTGRENIYLNGAILGMETREIRYKFDEIVDFAGIEKYIDTPVKRYSSGMYVRLAFAVAAHLDPDILIVDEVLAVGDAEFQKKAIGKMQNISKSKGRTVLFVRHNMTAVNNICPNTVLLKKGSIIWFGATSDIISNYLTSIIERKSWQGNILTEIVNLYSTCVRNVNSEGEKIYLNYQIEIIIELEIKTKINGFVCGFNLFSGFGYPILRANYNDYNLINTLNIGNYSLKFIIPNHFLAVGNYLIEFDLAIPNIAKLIGEDANLYFEVLAQGEIGNKYLQEGSSHYNSIIRPNLFIDSSLTPIEKNGN